RAAAGPQSQGAVVDVLDVGRERRFPAFRNMRPQQRRDRARRCGGAVARRASGQRLGVTFVQADDGGTQAAGGEELEPYELAACIDLQQMDFLCVEGADVELLRSC